MEGLKMIPLGLFAGVPMLGNEATEACLKYLQKALKEATEEKYDLFNPCGKPHNIAKVNQIILENEK